MVRASRLHREGHRFESYGAQDAQNLGGQAEKVIGSNPIVPAKMLIMEKFNPEKIIGEKIGEGAEKIVYRHKHDKEKVVGVFHKKYYTKETVRQIKSRFYLTKLLHILYPKNFPDMHLAASDPQMVIVDYVEGKPVDFGDRGKIFAFNKKFSDEIRVDMDGMSGNYQKDQAGNLIYVDTLRAYEIMKIDGEKQLCELFDRSELEWMVDGLPEQKKPKRFFISAD